MPAKTKILLVDDEEALLKAAGRVLADEGYRVTTANCGTDGLDKFSRENPDLVITDLFMPDLDGIQLLQRAKELRPSVEVLVITGHGSIERAVEAMKLGAYDFIEKPLDSDALVRTVGKAIEKHRLSLENLQLRELLEQQRGEDALIGNTPSILEIKKVIRQVAPSDVSVLIQGESGCGKEIVADAIHALSPRHNKVIIKISCAAIPDTLLESELFGYERGAFTGAAGAKPGKFELADGGHLFLDEIAEMSPPLQAKLLRVLQDGRCQRLGGTRDIQTDVRVISATHVNLERAIEEKKFRADLYFRLNVIQITIPPLRDRRDDIPLLASHFLKKHSSRLHKDVRTIAPEVMNQLIAHHWPGNVRELENVIQRAIAMATSDTIHTLQLVPLATSHAPSATIGSTLQIPIGATLEEIKNLVFAATVKHCGGDKEKAAKILDITSRTLYRHLPQQP